MLLTKAHYDLMEQFEKLRLGRFDREHKDLWGKGIIYQDGRVNALFLAYRSGYAFGIAAARESIGETGGAP